MLCVPLHPANLQYDTTAMQLLYPRRCICTDFVVEVGGAAFVRVASSVHPLANFAEILRSCGYREYEAPVYLEHVYKSDAKGLLSAEPSFLLVQ